MVAPAAGMHAGGGVQTVLRCGNGARCCLTVRAAGLQLTLTVPTLLPPRSHRRSNASSCACVGYARFGSLNHFGINDPQAEGSRQVSSDLAAGALLAALASLLGVLRCWTAAASCQQLPDTGCVCCDADHALRTACSVRPSQLQHQPRRSEHGAGRDGGLD